ncbi:ATP synthase F(0) complex subunit e, mitochondrial [Tenrec ecaudatus]|uniref:ATP synthase F(0) complex subunit e, mitochondrial n=1 Tax=Tenrec ecaudatus TaxID=94439 RepID=UPI003F595178
MEQSGISPRIVLPVRRSGTRWCPPVQVSPLIKLTRYSALFLGVAYGAKRYSYLKPRAEEERRIAAEEKKKQDELKRIARELAEAQDDSILK